jgi:Bacterial lipocalin
MTLRPAGCLASGGWLTACTSLPPPQIGGLGPSRASGGAVAQNCLPPHWCQSGSAQTKYPGARETYSWGQDLRAGRPQEEKSQGRFSSSGDGDYSILAFDPACPSVGAGPPNHKYFSILARQKPPEPGILEGIRSRFAAKHHDVSRLRPTPSLAQN